MNNMNIDKSLIVICFLYYFYRYGTPPVISNYFFKLYVDSLHLFFKVFHADDLFIQNKSEYQNKKSYGPKNYFNYSNMDVRFLCYIQQQ